MNFENLQFWYEINVNNFQKDNVRQNFLSRNTAHLASFWILGIFHHHSALGFYSAPHSSSVEPGACRHALWGKCWRRKDSRHSPYTSDVGGSSSQAKFAWENMGRLMLVMTFQHLLKTTPMSHLRGPHGQLPPALTLQPMIP